MAALANCRTGTWAARHQEKIGNVTKNSPFAVAQRIGMGGHVPWYGIILGGVILGLLLLATYGLCLGLISVYSCMSRRSKHSSSELMERNKDEYAFNFLSFRVGCLTAYLVTSTHLFGCVITITLDLSNASLSFLFTRVPCTLYTHCENFSLSMDVPVTHAK